MACTTFTVGTAASHLRSDVEKWIRWHAVNARLEGDIRPTAPQLDPQPVVEPLMPRTLSPYDIEVFINENPQANLSRLWSELGITTQERRGEASDLTECQGCRSELFNYDFDGQPGDEVLLRIQVDLESFRYLVFRSNPGQGDWQLLGHVDAWGKYQEPSHTVLLSGERTWLVIRDQAMRGSGVASYIERVFAITSNRMLEAMSYVGDGHQSGMGFEPTREFASQILSCRLTDGIVTASVRYVVDYTTWDPEASDKSIVLFQRRQTTVFVKNLRTNVQRLDEQHSECSARELRAVYDIDSLTNEAFLKYNYEQLTRIARGSNSVKKTWLRSLLNDCEWTAERQRLDAVLN